MSMMTDSRALEVLSVMFQFCANDRQMTEADALAKAIARLREPAGVGVECMDALRNYRQADRDGVMVTVSRQALDEAIAALSAPQPPAEAQAQGGGEAEPTACKDIPDWAIARSYRKHVDALDPHFRAPSALIFASNVTVEADRMARTAPPSAPDPVDERMEAMMEHGMASWCATPKDVAPSAPVGVECNCPGEGKTDPSLHAPNCPARLAQQPAPSAPVGVEGLIEEWESDLAEDKRDGVSEVAIRVQEIRLDQLRALAQQPAAVDGVCGDACAHIAIERDMLKASAELLAEALDDLLSWIPDKPAPPEWRFPAGEYGADAAIEAARAALHPTAAQEGKSDE